MATRNGQRGVVSPALWTYDIEEGKPIPRQRLTHGNEILPNILPEYPAIGDAVRYGNRLHTLPAVFHAFNHYQPEMPPAFVAPPQIDDALGLFVGYLLFDAWIDNTDRHHENWAFIEQNQEPKRFFLSPTYDHASCLECHLKNEERERRLNTSDLLYSVAAYAKRARSGLYGDSGDKKALLTIDAFAHLARLRPEAGRFWLERLSQVHDDAISSVLQRFPAERASPRETRFAAELMRANRAALLLLEI